MENFKCIDCGNKRSPMASRCFKCARKHKSEMMKGDNNIAKRQDVKQKLSAKMQGEFGEKNRNWKGGFTNIKGYVYIYMPKHPNADTKGYYPYHRYIMEQHLGRFLDKSEVVHHIDENILNNDINNLKLFDTFGKHRSFHQIGKLYLRNSQGKFAI
jgi:hypothetical protein